MSTLSPDVGVLRQQMSTLRGENTGGSQGSTGGASRRGGGHSLKLAMLGPCQAGKTKISSQIAHMPFPARYEPTAGVRILELTEEGLVDVDGSPLPALSIELWDCSGDQKFESCWPAICDQLDGCVVTFDPTNKGQANDVRLWCEWFCKRAELADGQVAIFAHGELSGSHKPLSVRAGERTVIVPIVNVSTVNLPPPDEEGRPQMGPAKLEWRKFVATCWDAVNGNA